jgi:Type II secretion system (T2SS), protein N
MFRILLAVAALLVALVAATAFIPLGTALKMSGAEAQGLSWTTAKGSVLSGRLEGLAFKTREYGAADVKLVPAALADRSLAYAVDWQGPSGTGTGKVSLMADKSIALENYVIDLDMVPFAKSAKWIERSGGRLELIGSRIRFLDGACVEALGTATSDVLDRNRDALGTGWSSLTGELSCENGMLLMPLTSENASGTIFSAAVLAAPGAKTEFEARISGNISRPMRFALPLAGFDRDGEDFVYVPKASKVVATAP